MNGTVISVIVPAYNESRNIPKLYDEFRAMAAKVPYEFEYIFVNDGSTDNTVRIVEDMAAKDPAVKLVNLSRNFGKEIATTAGLNASTGDAAIMIDADLQHPVALIPEFIFKWEQGADVVVGVRLPDATVSLGNRLRVWMFYRILNSMAETKVVPNATDFRLMDRMVVNEFNRFTERNRITRGLIDWLGYEREYLYFKAGKREDGAARYSTSQLIRLAVNSFVSLSLVPLKIAGYVGIAITMLSALLGAFIFVVRYILNDPWDMNFSGPAILAVINMFLVGIILMSLGLVALYIANIHSEVINRPLYVVKRPRPSLIQSSAEPIPEAIAKAVARKKQ